MSHLESRVKKLESGNSPNDLDEFLVAVYAYVYPDAPPLIIKNPSTKTVKEFWATCKPLRPAISYEDQPPTPYNDPAE
jgi:hypothetical protein